IYTPITPPNLLKPMAQESIYLLGGHFAILCQFAHPALAEGSYKHSNFAGRIMNRLQTTARFLNAAVFGTPREQSAIFAAIHEKHALVRGDAYSADDPELHKWTAATLFVALVVVHEAFFGPLEAERTEALYKEAAVYGTSLRMPPELWPPSLAAFWSYWDAQVAELVVTPYAKSLARDLMYPRNMPWWYGPGAPVARLLTGFWLPERFAVEYGLGRGWGRRRAYGGVVRVVSGVYGRVPGRWRTKPHRVYMEDLRKAVGRLEGGGGW
ncbi:hypothetical protein BS50DRAFT_447441, partial [Corynespora cassiicola Philippines]